MKLGIIFVLATAASAHAQSPQADFIRNLAEKPPTLTAFPRLLNALEDKDPKVRMEALKAWAKVGKKYVELYNDELNEQAIDQNKISQFLTDEFHQSLIAKIKPTRRDDVKTKLQAIRTLCKLADSADSICPIIFGYEIPSQPHLHSVAEDQLRNEETENHQLLESLIFDPDPDVVYNVLNSLGYKIRDKQLGLARNFLKDSNKYFRAIGLNLIQKLRFDSSWILVAPFLDDPDKDVRVTAEACLQLTDDQAAKLVLPSPGRPDSLRQAAVNKLCNFPQEKWFSLFERLLSDDVAEIRAAALIHLFAYDKSRDSKTLVPFHSDPSPIVQAAALMVASWSPTPNAISLFREALLSPERCKRDAALCWVGRLPNCEQLSLEQVRCVELGVKRYNSGIIAFDDPRFSELREKCLTSKNPDMRILVVHHYTHGQKWTASSDILIRLAKDPDFDVAGDAISYLAGVSEPWGYQTLVELLSSPVQDSRCLAIHLLAESNNPSAIATLLPLTLSQDRPTRVAAKHAVTILKYKLPKP